MTISDFTSDYPCFCMCLHMSHFSVSSYEKLKRCNHRGVTARTTPRSGDILSVSIVNGRITFYPPGTNWFKSCRFKIKKTLSKNADFARCFQSYIFDWTVIPHMNYSFDERALLKISWPWNNFNFNELPKILATKVYLLASLIDPSSSRVKRLWA